MNLVARSEGAGVPMFAGNYMPELLLRAVSVVEDGRVDLLQGKIPHQLEMCARKIRGEGRRREGSGLTRFAEI